MNKQKIVLISIGVILMVVLGVIFLLPRGENWYLSLGENENPYDVDFFYDLIENSNPEIEVSNVSDFYNETLIEIEDSTSTLLKISHSANLDSTEVFHLLDYVEKGNKVFYVMKYHPQLLMASILYSRDKIDSLNSILNTNNPYLSYQDPAQWDSISQTRDSANSILNSDFGLESFHTPETQNVNIADKSTQIYYRDKKDINRSFQYSYFNLSEKFKNKYEVIGSIEQFDNFIKINVGKGSIYFHSTPLAFTNLHLYQEETKQYAQRFLQEFNSGNVYIDDFYHFSPSSNSGSSNYSRNPNLPSSPLAFILSIATLKWAWYLLLFGTILFLIFRSKRNQRLIPVIAPMQNNSLEFSKTVGRLYYKEKNHKRMAQEICLYFFNHLRKRYHINTKTFDDSSKNRFIKLFPLETRKINIIAHLSVKSFTKESEITQQELEELYKATRFFILKK